MGIARDEMEDFRDLCPEYRLLAILVELCKRPQLVGGASDDFDEDGGTQRRRRMKMAEALAKFYGVPDGVWRIYAPFGAGHRTWLSIHDLIRKWAVSDEQQNGVRQAVNFKRACTQMEDRCARLLAGLIRNGLPRSEYSQLAPRFTMPSKACETTAKVDEHGDL